MDVLRKICVDVPFLEALKEASSYLKLLRELLLKKGKVEEFTMVLVGDIL